jgi:hypothetical protein
MVEISRNFVALSEYMNFTSLTYDIYFSFHFLFWFIRGIYTLNFRFYVNFVDKERTCLRFKVLHKYEGNILFGGIL